MKTFILEIELLTPCLIGSGTGYGSFIDSDIVFDDLGIPFIPSKRVKGCLRDSAIEICEYFAGAGINLFDLSKDKEDFSVVLKTFGMYGDDEPAEVYFSNLMIEGYQQTMEWLKYLVNEFGNIVNKESITSYFTELRQQTAIDESIGTAMKHSLRTIRVAKRGLIFRGDIDIARESPDIIRLLYFAAKNLRHMGTKRTRGFGAIRCKLLDKDKELNLMNELEEICKK